MIKHLMPANLKRVVVYLPPISMRWGVTKLRSRGEAKGRVEGARRVLLQILELKFGELPSPEQERVLAASEEEISRWTARVLAADSLAAVLAN